MKYFSIDRINDSSAICIDETGKAHVVKKSKLPKDIKEGVMLIMLDNKKILIDKSETALRRKNIKDLENSIFKNQIQ